MSVGDNNGVVGDRVAVKVITLMKDGGEGGVVSSGKVLETSGK